MASLPLPGLDDVVVVVELLINIHKFVNIELHSQGWYAVRVKVPTEGCVKAVVPFSFIDSELKDAQPPPEQVWTLDEHSQWFRTSIFKIRYCYEEVFLGESIVFHLYCTDFQNLDTLCCKVEYELLFQEADINSPTVVPAVLSLKPVAKDVVRISRLAAGVHHYHGSTFSDDYMGLCVSGVFSQLSSLTTVQAMEGLLDGAGRKKANWLCSGATEQSAVWNYARRSVDTLRVSSTVSPVILLHHTSSMAHAHSIRDVLLSCVESDSAIFGHSTVGAAAIATTREERVAILYRALVGELRRAHGSLLSFLKGMPAQVFAPQTFEVLRKLVGTNRHVQENGSNSAGGSFLHHRAGGGGGGGASGVGGVPNEHLLSLTAPPTPACGSTPDSPLAHSRLQSPAPRLGSFGPQSPVPHGGGGGGGLNGTLGRIHGRLSPHGPAGPAPMDPLVVFLSQLPQNSSAEAAVAHLERAIADQLAEMSTNWEVLMWVLRASSHELVRHIKRGWEVQQPQQVAPWVSLEGGMLSPSSEDQSHAHAAQLRQGLRFQLSGGVPRVAQVAFWDRPDEQPILYVDDTHAQPAGELPQESQALHNAEASAHVVVLVHGFQGASSDLCLVRAHLAMMAPGLECFASKVNECNTNGSFSDMAARLADEVATHLAASYGPTSRRPLGRLSFVGHSIGNIILRAALTTPALAPYLPYLWMYISISGPHLGFLYTSNAVMETGLSFLKALRRGKFLHELTFTDAPTVQQGYLYRLAQTSPLSLFRHVVLVASPQDRYVPFHSARVSSCEMSQREAHGKRGAAYLQMIKELLKGVRAAGPAGAGGNSHGGSGNGDASGASGPAPTVSAVGASGSSQQQQQQQRPPTSLLRVDVDFCLKTKVFSLSKLVGRTAHIQFIESGTYVRLLTWGVLLRYGLLQEVPYAWL